MENAAHPSSHSARERTSLQVVRAILVVIFAFLAFMVGIGMVNHRFFRGGHAQQNGSIAP